MVQRVGVDGWGIMGEGMGGGMGGGMAGGMAWVGGIGGL